MLVGDSRSRATVVTSDGAAHTTINVPMTIAQARVLRAYEIAIVEKLRLRVTRICQECHQEVEVYVDPITIGATCACHTRLFAGPTEGMSIASSVEPPPFIRGPLGEVIARRSRFTDDEARLLRAYKREILIPFRWGEKMFCQDCFERNVNDGAHARVTDTDDVFVVCRCREMTYRGITA